MEFKFVGDNYVVCVVDPSTLGFNMMDPEVAVKLPIEVDELAQRLLNVSVGSGDSKGLLVFNIFANSICTFTAKTSDIFVRTIINGLNKTRFTEISILLKFIDYVAHTKMLRKQYGKGVIKSISILLSKINDWWKRHPDVDSKYSVLSIMTKMLLIDSNDSALELLPFFVQDSTETDTFTDKKPNQGNELSAEIIKLSLEFKRVKYETEPEHKELLRKLNCARYSSLIAVVTCTQNDLKFYNAFLFKENHAKQTMSRERKFVTVRHNIRNESEENENSTLSSDIPSSLNLFNSENLGLSSLAEDVSKFLYPRSEKGDKTSDFKSKKSFIEAESIPPWLNCIIQSLEDGKLCENVRLFLGRVVVNNAEILKPYAKFLMDPLLDLIILGIAGFSLNYYILDIIIALLSWAPDVVPRENQFHKANEILKFIIKNCEHSRKEIFRNNLEVIKTLLECWKNGLEIPYDKELLGVVLSGNFPPFDCENIEKAESYFSALLHNLSHKYKEVYGSAAEVVSLALKILLKDEKDVTSNPFFLKVVEKLENLKNKEEEKFLYCLNKIHVGCPPIADKFISRLLFLYPRVYSSFKNFVLEILCSRVNDIENGYQEFKVIGLFEDMEKKSEASQLMLLQSLKN
ncbi:DNA-dependent protein kinase catalytic subunit [Caerostris extrusa]|uniref:DNA-dependent protein kinase catalytic subunit n=1 Tax=Caerostris extrusa TaxID=172846 RepID=A0AAV4MA45_CAEEX|nr:DNA-dependent protein kinase catalytic subunit [Caerostris extrusa]